LTHLITVYSCNRNVTLKMAGTPAEKCRCKYHNKITSGIRCILLVLDTLYTN